MKTPRAMPLPQLCDRGLQRLPKRVWSLVPLPEHARAMVLFRQVDQVEVACEGSGHLLSPLERPRSHQLLCIALIPTVIPRADDRPPELFDVAQQLGAAVVRNHLAENVPQHADVPPERCGDLLACDPPPPFQGGGSGRGALSTRANQICPAVIANCAYSKESISAAREASMMLLEQPTVVHRFRPLPDSTSTLVVAAVPAAPSRMRTL
jgi:hypothetical protein